MKSMRYFCTVLILFLGTCLLHAQKKTFNAPLPEKATAFQTAWLEADPDCGRNINEEFRDRIKDLKNYHQLRTIAYSMEDPAERVRFFSWLIMQSLEIQPGFRTDMFRTLTEFIFTSPDPDVQKYCRFLLTLLKTDQQNAANIILDANRPQFVFFRETPAQRQWRERLQMGSSHAQKPASVKIQYRIGFTSRKNIDLGSYPKRKTRLPSAEIMELFTILSENKVWNGDKQPENSPLANNVRAFLLALVFDETDFPADQKSAFLDKHKEFFLKYGLLPYLFARMEPFLQEKDYKGALNILTKAEVPQNRQYQSGFPFFSNYHNAVNQLQQHENAKPVPVLEWDMKCTEFDAMLADAETRGDSVFFLIRRELDARGERYFMTKDPDLFAPSLPSFRKTLLEERGGEYHKKLKSFLDLQQKNGFLTERGLLHSYRAYSLDPAEDLKFSAAPFRVPVLPEKLSAPEKIFDLPSSLDEFHVVNNSWRLPPLSVSGDGDYTFFRNMKELICYYKGDLQWRVQEPPVVSRLSLKQYIHEPVFRCGDLALARRQFSTSAYSGSIGLQAFDLKTGREVWSRLIPNTSVADFAVAEDGIIVLAVGRDPLQRAAGQQNGHFGGNNNNQIALLRLNPENGQVENGRVLSEMNRNTHNIGFSLRMKLRGNMVYVDSPEGMIFAFDRIKWENRWMRRYARVISGQDLERIELIRRTSSAIEAEGNSYMLAQARQWNPGQNFHPLLLSRMNDLIVCGENVLIHAPFNGGSISRIDSGSGALLGGTMCPKGAVLGDEQAVFVIGADHSVTVFDPVTMKQCAAGRLQDYAAVLKDWSGNGRLAVYENGKIIVRDRNWKIVSELVLPAGFAPLHGGSDHALYLFREADVDYGIYQAVKTLQAEKKVSADTENDPVERNLKAVKIFASLQHNNAGMILPTEEEFRIAAKLFPVLPEIFPYQFYSNSSRDDVLYVEGSGTPLQMFSGSNARCSFSEDGSLFTFPQYNIRSVRISPECIFLLYNNSLQVFSRKDGSLLAVSGKFQSRKMLESGNINRPSLWGADNAFVHENEFYALMSDERGLSDLYAFGKNGSRKVYDLDISNSQMVQMTRYGRIFHRHENGQSLYKLYPFNVPQPDKNGNVSPASTPNPAREPEMKALLEEIRANHQHNKNVPAAFTLPGLDPADKKAWKCQPQWNTTHSRYVLFHKDKMSLFPPDNKFLIWDTKTGAAHTFAIPAIPYPAKLLRKSSNNLQWKQIYVEDKYLILNVQCDLQNIYHAAARQLYFIYDLESGKELVPGFVSVVFPRKVGDRFYGIRSDFNGQNNSNQKVQLKVICADISRKQMIDLQGDTTFEVQPHQYQSSSSKIQSQIFQDRLYFALLSTYYNNSGSRLWEIPQSGDNVKAHTLPSGQIHFLPDSRIMVMNSGSGATRSSIYPFSMFRQHLDKQTYRSKPQAGFYEKFILDGYPDEWDPDGWIVQGKNAWQIQQLQSNTAALIVRIGDPVLVDYLCQPGRAEKCTIIISSHGIAKQQEQNFYVDPVEGVIYFEYQINVRSVSQGKSMTRLVDFDFLPFPGLPGWGIFGGGCYFLAPACQL